MPVLLFTIRNVCEVVDQNTCVSWVVPFPPCRQLLREDKLYWVGLLVKSQWGGVCVVRGQGGISLFILKVIAIMLTLSWPRPVDTRLSWEQSHCWAVQGPAVLMAGWPHLSLWTLLASLRWPSCFCQSILLRWGTVTARANAGDLRRQLFSPEKLSRHRD